MVDAGKWEYPNKLEETWWSEVTSLIALRRSVTEVPKLG